MLKYHQESFTYNLTKNIKHISFLHSHHLEGARGGDRRGDGGLPKIAGEGCGGGGGQCLMFGKGK
jgi:hypothetical protein